MANKAVVGLVTFLIIGLVIAVAVLGDFYRRHKDDKCPEATCPESAAGTSTDSTSGSSNGSGGTTSPSDTTPPLNPNVVTLKSGSTFTANPIPFLQRETTEGNFAVYFQTDGNIVLKQDDKPLNSTRTDTTNRLNKGEFATDGTLTLFTGDNKPYLRVKPSTTGTAPYTLQLSSDGKQIEIVDKTGKSLWSGQISAIPTV